MMLSRSQAPAAATNTSKNVRILTSVCIVSALAIAIGGILPYWLAVVVISCAVLLDLLKVMDEVPPIREVAAMISVIQLLLGPLLLFAFFNDHHRYRMYVSESEYFSFTVPAVCAFVLALRLKLPLGVEVPRLATLEKSKLKIGITLVLGGLAAGVLSRFGPGSLAFFFYLLANMRYVGAIYVWRSGNQFRLPLVGLVIAGLYLTSAKHGMFHELLLWITLGGSYWFVGYRRSIALKVAGVLTLALVVSVIQGIKPQFRKSLETDPNLSLASSVQDYLRSDHLFSEEWAQNIVARLSQGWIVSAAMRTVPAQVPYANGETIYEAFIASIVPRAILSGKRGANSQEMVNRYTNLNIRGSTSMGLSPLGEAYVNFGRRGAILTFFLYGILINAVYRLLAQLSWKNEFFFFCLPLVFLQVVKVETDFTIVLNHLAKSLIIVSAVYYGLRLLGLDQSDEGFPISNRETAFASGQQTLH